MNGPHENRSLYGLLIEWYCCCCFFFNSDVFILYSDGIYTMVFCVWFFFHRFAVFFSFRNMIICQAAIIEKSTSSCASNEKYVACVSQWIVYTFSKSFHYLVASLGAYVLQCIVDFVCFVCRSYSFVCFCYRLSCATERRSLYGTRRKQAHTFNEKHRFLQMNSR